MAERGCPLLWGGCFLVLVLGLWFSSGGFLLSHPLGLQLLEAVGLANPGSLQVLWEYASGPGDAVLVSWGEGGFSPQGYAETGGRVIALGPEGEEVWQREVPGGRLVARGPYFAVVEPSHGEVALYRHDGRLAWRQRWTWPFQEAVLSPTGEMAVFLGPLQEAEGNLVEKLVYVNTAGQVVWEHLVRNGTILGCRFDPQGEYLAVNKLLFHRQGVESQLVVLDREGEARGRFTAGGESLVFDTALAEEAGTWVLAGARTVYCLTLPGQVCWQYPFDRPLQRLALDPVHGGVVAVTQGPGGARAGCILTYLDREGQVRWEQRFGSPASELFLGVAPGGVVAGDTAGVYGFSYDGEILWYYSAPMLSGLALDPAGERLLVQSESGVLTMLQVPWD